MPRRGTESEFELTTIDRLELLGYRYVHGIELDRPKEEVVLRDRLQLALQQRYGDLPPDAIEEAVKRFSRPEGVDTIRRNMAFQKMLREGIELPVERPDGRVDYEHVYAIDWDDPEGNDFLVVNQLSVKGQNDRRPDLVVYVNGLPLVVFELKSPWDEYTTGGGRLQPGAPLRPGHPAALRHQRPSRSTGPSPTARTSGPVCGSPSSVSWRSEG